ncbi:MAG: class I SAM-dependent methyltransferase [Mycobacteriales bacterium]
MSDPKTVAVTPQVHEYMLAHSTPLDDMQLGLITATAQLTGDQAGMQIAPEQGAFMTMLARVMGAKNAIEVGTFTGYSAMALARGLRPDGRLVCCDISEEWTSIGRPYWEGAGVADRIELRIGPAIETLRALPADAVFDIAFIDADKPSYSLYYEEILTRLRTGGLLLADNVLWSGNIVDEESTDDNTVALRAFNDLVAADARVDVVMLPIADGLSLIRKK